MKDVHVSDLDCRDECFYLSEMVSEYLNVLFELFKMAVSEFED